MTHKYFWGWFETHWRLIKRTSDGFMWYDLGRCYPSKVVPFKLMPGMIWKRIDNNLVIRILPDGHHTYYNTDVRCNVKSSTELETLIYSFYAPFFNPYDFINLDSSDRK